MNNVYMQGIKFFDPRGKYELAKVSIDRSKLIEWLNEQEADERGYIRLELKSTKAGSYCLKLDTYKPKSKPQEEVVADDDLPF